MSTETETLIDHSRDVAASIEAIQAGLAGLLAWSEAHPDIELHRCGLTFIPLHNELPPVELIRAIKDGAPIGMVRKHPGISQPEILFVERGFGGGVELSYQAARDEVCTARVVRTETVEVPDPDAPKVTVERDVIEWDCHPILSDAS